MNVAVILYVDISGSTIMIRIISDDDIQIQVPKGLSTITGIGDYQKLGGPKHALQVLRRIRLSLRGRMIDRL